MSSINFDNVYLLLIAIPLIALLVVPFCIAVKKDNANGHNIASCALHVIMALLIAFTAAGTKIVTVVTQTNVYVVADVSYSAEKNLDLVDEYIFSLKSELPKNSRMGVICFGKDYQLLTKLGENLKSVKQASVDDTQTNIVDALEYAGSLFRDDVIKRIVLITDGKQTDTTDSNALKRTVDALNAQNIYVDAIYVDDNITSATKEVQLSSVEYTQNAYLNSSENALVTIQSTYETDVNVTLFKEDEQISKKVVHLSEGSTTVNMPLDTEESGTFSYEVKVEADDDYNKNNNSNFFTQNVTGAVNVLLITKQSADYEAISQLYGESAVIKAYINNANVPCGVEELCLYDVIIISNADISQLNNHEMFIQSLDTVVSRFGKSLITIGDTNIENNNDLTSDTYSTLSSLDEMLPVRFGNTYQDAKLYTIVIDISLSMDSASRFAVAKSAAKKLVGILNENDYVSVVYFYGDVQILQKPELVSNCPDLVDKIGDLTAAQGTMISKGLSEALDLLIDAPYSTKSVMLISDGLKYADESPLEVAEQMYANGIALSVIDVGRGSANDTTAVQAENTLKNLAVRGGGDYYYVNGSLDEAYDDLNDIVFGQLGGEINDTIIERKSLVKVNKRYDDVMEGVDDLTYIYGFVNSKAKASATTILTTDYQKSNGASVSVPLYAYWSYGNGKVASFTSAISGSWIKDWTADGSAEIFFGNLLQTNTPDEQNNYPYSVNVSRDESYTYIEITPATIRVDATVTIELTNPSEETTTTPLIMDEGVYSYGFYTPDVGEYDVTISYTYGGVTYTSNNSFTISYLSEYDSFATFDSSALHKMVSSMGKVSEDGKLTIVNDDSLVGLQTINLTAPFMVACVALFAVDIIIRKLKWEDIRSLFKKVNKQGK